MRRFIYVAILPVFAACSGSTPDDPSALSEPLAQNISISEIAILQSLKVPVMRSGDVADRGDLPLIALRDSVLRVYVNPESAFQPHTLTARARITTSSPTGDFAQVFSATASVSGPTVEKDLSTSINIPIPGIVLEPGASVTVVLNDTKGDDATTPTSTARWPQDGTSSDLGVVSGSDHVRVMIVPVEYDADGSGRLPDTSDTQLEAYRKRFFQLYPTAEVDITVHDPWPYSGAISGSGAGFSEVLTALGQLRAADQPDPDVYYYGAFSPTADFGSFCGGGCIAGLSPIGAPYSVGLGFFGDVASGTAVHEVGHAHGRAHAPCGGAGSPDPNYPYPGGLIGVWGYDPFGPLMIDPQAYTDMMSYCSPTWISDYHYNLIFKRVRTDNKYYNDWMSGTSSRATLPPYAIAPVEETGDVHVSTTALREPWISEGAPREITWDGGKATAYFHPYDHLPGGVLYVPSEVPALASVSALRAGESARLVVR